MRCTFAVAVIAFISVACGGGSEPIDETGQDALIQQGGGAAETVPALIPTATPEAEPQIAAVTEEAAIEELPFAPNPAPWAEAPAAAEDAAARVPNVDALAAIVVDEASGATLWEHNADQALPPASTTKILTALVALEHGDLDRWVQVDVDWREMPGSSVMGLQRGEWFRMRDLLYGLMLPSGNDAALAIARDVSGSDAAFVAEMNALVERLGLKTAHFENPHGLTARGHVISAHDLAHLSRYAMSIDEFRPLAWTRWHTAKGHSRDIAMGNLNGILHDYPGADGIKVGFTYRAGKTLVASATRDGHRVYVVLLNAPKSRTDGAKLLDWAFANHTWPN